MNLPPSRPIQIFGHCLDQIAISLCEIFCICYQNNYNFHLNINVGTICYIINKPWGYLKPRNPRKLSPFHQHLSYFQKKTVTDAAKRQNHSILDIGNTKASKKNNFSSQYNF